MVRVYGSEKDLKYGKDDGDDDEKNGLELGLGLGIPHPVQISRCMECEFVTPRIPQHPCVPLLAFEVELL